MTRNRPAPDGNRPAPDATNVSIIVEQSELFAATPSSIFGKIGTVEFTDPVESTTSSGPRRRDVGHRLVEGNAASAAYIKCGERWVRERLAEDAQELDAEMLRRDLGDPPTSAAVGAVFRRCALLGLIKKTGVRRSDRPEARARDLATWGPR